MKKKYQVAINEYVPLREYSDMTTFIIESNKNAKELEKEIVAFNKKKGRSITVHVLEMKEGKKEAQRSREKVKE